MKQASHQLSVSTRGKGLYEITGEVDSWTRNQKFSDGLLTIFVPHTSASLLIQENADPDVVRDLSDFFSRIAPEDRKLYRHVSEGLDDMPAHIRTALTQTHLAMPLIDGRLALGTWQGIYLFEHRSSPHRRRVLLHLIGEG